MKKIILSLMMGLILLSGIIVPPQPQEPSVKMLDHNGWGG